MAVGRSTLVTAITTFLADHDPRTLSAIREALEREIDGAGPEALALLNERLGDSGNGWHYCQADPLARRIHHVLADSLLHHESALYGVEHAAALSAQPVVIFANHLSYSDANLLEILLQRFGGSLYHWHECRVRLGSSRNRRGRNALVRKQHQHRGCGR